MKLLLVQPAQLQQTGAPRKSKKVFFTPLSVYLLAGLTPREWDIEVVNDYTDEPNYEGHYDLVGITSSTIHSHRAYEIAAKFRARKIPVVMGGFHPTLFTQEAKEHCDFIVVGEAELIWEKALDDFKNGRTQPTYQANRFSDLANLPVPRYDLLNKKKYMNDIMPAESTRGCPYNCDYCSVTQFYGTKFRHRPVDDVVRDIKATRSRFIAFVDDNIAGRLDYAERLFDAMTPLKIFWMSQMSIRLADDESILAKASRSGCRYAIVGIETLDTSNLAAVGKKNVNVVADYISKTKIFKKHGITVAANLMFGFDNDTEETFERTYKFVEQNYFMPNPYIVTPYPGTRLYDRMKNEGRLLHTDYWRYTSYQTVFKPVNFTPERLDELFLNFYKRSYSYLNILKRFIHNLWSKQPFGSFMTQLALAANSLAVRRNVYKGVLPYY